MTNPGTQFKRGNTAGLATRFKKGIAPNPGGFSKKLKLWIVIKKIMMNSAVTQDEIKTLQGLKK